MTGPRKGSHYNKVRNLTPVAVQLLALQQHIETAQFSDPAETRAVFNRVLHLISAILGKGLPS